MKVCASYRCAGNSTTLHCSTVQSKMHCLLLTAAVQNRVTSGVCLCKYTYEDLRFIQVCSDAQTVHYEIVQGKMHHSTFSAASAKRVDSRKLFENELIRICSSYRCAEANTSAMQQCSGHVLLAGQAVTTTARQTGIIAPATQIRSAAAAAASQGPSGNHKCTAALFSAKCIAQCSVLLCKNG